MGKKNSVFQYKMLISIPNTKGELAKVLAYLSKSDFYILACNFGRQNTHIFNIVI